MQSRERKKTYGKFNLVNFEKYGSSLNIFKKGDMNHDIAG